MCVSVLAFEIQLSRGGRVGIPLTCLTSTYLCVCPKPGPWFPTSYVVLVLIFNEVTYEAIVRYVDIVGNADHYCLNFLLIIIFMDILYDLFPHTINNHSKLPSVNPWFYARKNVVLDFLCVIIILCQVVNV